MPGPVDYRSPQTRNDRVRTVHDQLGLREHLMLGKIALLLGAGLPVTFLGSLIISWIWFQARDRAGGSGSFVLLFLAVSALVVPFFFWLERRTDGRLMEGWLNDGGPASRSWDINSWNALAGYYADPEVVLSFYLLIALWGPRLILEAVGKIRVVRQISRADRERAEQVVARLLASKDAIDIHELELSQQQMHELLAGLAYLLVYDWIDVSQDGRRVWLTSDSRKKLSS